MLSGMDLLFILTQLREKVQRYVVLLCNSL